MDSVIFIFHNHKSLKRSFKFTIPPLSFITHNQNHKNVRQTRHEAGVSMTRKLVKSSTGLTEWTAMQYDILLTSMGNGLVSGGRSSKPDDVLAGFSTGMVLWVGLSHTSLIIYLTECNVDTGSLEAGAVSEFNNNEHRMIQNKRYVRQGNITNTTS